MYKSIRTKLIDWLIIGVFLLSPAMLGFRSESVASASQGIQHTPGPRLVLLHDNRTIAYHVPPPSHTGGLGIQMATFIVHYNPASCTGSVTPWPQEAQDAFAFAVDIWRSLIHSSQTIEVDVCWVSDLPPGVLGGAGATTLHRDFTGAPVANTWYPAALASGLANSDLNGSDVEIEAVFSSTSNWYFGVDGSTPADRVDFATVVLHELGHGLGFFGSMTVSSDGKGNWGLGTSFPVIYDRLAEDIGSTSLLNTGVYPQDSVALASALTSGDVFFNGPNANAANGGTRVELYAPSPWRQGSSYSHLDEVFNNTPNALMTYSLGNGESIHNPGPVTLGMFTDMGWPLDQMIIPVVTNDPYISNDGLCSLIEAITNANDDAQTHADCPAGSGADIISLEAPDDSYLLTTVDNDTDGPNGLPSITSEITINGNGATIQRDSTVDALFRIFHVASGGKLTLNNLTVSRGRPTPESAGSGIFNRGDLTLTDCTVSWNEASHSGGTFTSRGGGIFNDAGGTVWVERSTIGPNGAHTGGGIFNDGGEVWLINSTVSGNIVTDDGGGIFNVDGTVNLVISTVSHNQAFGASGGDGIFNHPFFEDGTVALVNTIVAENSDEDCFGTITSFGHNLDSDGSCGLSETGDLSLQDPKLGPLWDNGGPTKTCALWHNSPAIDAGDNNPLYCPDTDQRGLHRPVDGDGDGIATCDIGAFERHGPPTAVTLTSFTAQPNVGQVHLAWETASEIDNAGFNLYRAGTESGPYVIINAALIAAQGDAISGASYGFIDEGLVPGVYFYKLDDVDTAGGVTSHGPVWARVLPRFRRPLYRPTLPK